VQISFCEGEFAWEGTRLQISAEALDGALYADADAFPDGCVIRARQEGDVFQPFGGSEKKLKEYLTNKKIPARVGRTLPLVVKGGEVYAIFGVEISEKVKVPQNTSRKIYLRVK
jgi:tRNA(Ile)-lysidine synthetase-like protein